MGVLINLTVTQFLPSVGEKGNVGPSQKGRSRAMAAAWQQAQSITSPGALWWLQPLPSTARRLTHLQSLRKYFLFSAKTHISYLCIQSFFLFSHFLVKTSCICFFKGCKMPALLFIFFQHFLVTNKCFLSSSCHYRAEVREQSASSWEKKKNCSQLFLTFRSIHVQ